jgi:hypothetical protein
MENNKNNNNKCHKFHYNKSNKDSPKHNQYNNSKNYVDRALDSTLSIINKNDNKDKVLLKEDLNINIKIL